MERNYLLPERKLERAVAILEKVITRIFLGKAEEQVAEEKDPKQDWKDKLMHFIVDEEKVVSAGHHNTSDNQEEEKECVSLNA